MHMTEETTATGVTARPSWKSAVRGNVLAMGLVSLFTDFSSEMMNPLLPIFIAGLVGGVKAAFYVGLMEGIAETTASILKIYSGRISDRAGKRKALVIAGYGASTVVRPLMGLAGLVSAATGGLQVVVLKFLDRVGKGVRTSPRDALIGDSVPKEVRGLAFSFHRSMDHTGAVLGPVAAMVIAYSFMGSALWDKPAMVAQKEAVGPTEMNALRWMFGLAIVPGIAAMLALFGMVKEITPQAGGAGKQGDHAKLPAKFYSFVAIVSLFTLGNSSDLFIVLLGAKVFQLSLLELLILWMVFHVSKIVFSIPGGLLSDRYGRRPVIVAGWLVYALVYMGFALAAPGAEGSPANKELFWTLILIYGIYFGLAEGSEKALVADFVPSANRATAFGIYSAAIGIAALPASLLFGVFWEFIGPKVAFGIGAGLAGLATVLLAVLLSTKTKPAD